MEDKFFYEMLNLMVYAYNDGLKRPHGTWLTKVQAQDPLMAWAREIGRKQHDLQAKVERLEKMLEKENDYAGN